MAVRRIGVLDDRDVTERRVALVPDTVRRLARDGFSVIVEAGAGTGACYGDQAYLDVGATTAARAEVLGAADMVVSVAGPRPGDVDAMHPGQLLVGLLARPGRDDLLRRLESLGVVTLSLDRLPRTLGRAQSMDVLSSQAGVAGYKAVLVAAEAFGRYLPMMITAAGTSRPAAVVVLGAGVAGLSAIGTARRLGAVVSAVDVRPAARAEVESLGARFLSLDAVGPAAGSGGYARALSDDEQRTQQEQLAAHLGAFDIVITTAQVPGRRPPLLVSAAALASMRPGSVVVDMGAGPLGGNVEGSVADARTTTPGGVVVIGAGHLAASVPSAASDAFSHNVAAVVASVVHDGELALDPADEVHAAVVVTGMAALRADAPALTGPSATWSPTAT